jgi:hypothetical protein
VQTGALGALKVLHFLSGFRMLSVKNNVIDKIHFVSTARLEANNYRLAWDEAILPDLPGPPDATWNSVSEGSSTPGGHVTAVATDDDQITLFLADRNGGTYTTSGNYQVGWEPWNSVSEGSSTPGAPVTAVVTGGQITLFLADANGGIYARTKSLQ